MNWSVASTKQRLSEVLRRAASRPQTITKRAKEIAVILDIQEFREFQQWKSSGRKKTVAQAFEDLRLVTGRGPALNAPGRRNRRRQFLPAAN